MKKVYLVSSIFVETIDGEETSHIEHFVEACSSLKIALARIDKHVDDAAKSAPSNYRVPVEVSIRIENDGDDHAKTVIVNTGYGMIEETTYFVREFTIDDFEDDPS